MRALVLTFIFVIKKTLIQNIKKLFQYKEILIEEFIPGREIQVAILGK